MTGMGSGNAKGGVTMSLPAPRSLRGLVGHNLLVTVFVLLLIAAPLFVPNFASLANVTNILQRNSIIGVVSCGMLLMIIVGGFDLSVGAVGAASSVLAAWAMVHVSLSAGVIAALVLGSLVGLANGTAIAKIGMNPFVTTLATQVLVSGILFVATSAQPVFGVPVGITWLAFGRIGPFPVPFLIFSVVALLVWILLQFTSFGRYIYAVGGNKNAARLAGVPVDPTIIGVYCIGGLFAALGGIMLLGQTTIGQPASATDWPLTAIAAVVVGGVPLSGGMGTVSGAVLGVFLLGVIANCLNLLGVSTYWQPAVTGAVIMISVGIDSYQRKRREGR
jgi:ribose/xylose/arabinose/galactoside ABC-type transport system permease subunit